jgi:hypothetical protein
MRIFGGRKALKRSPFQVVQKQRLVVLARWKVEGEKNKEVNDKIEKTNSELPS